MKKKFQEVRFSIFILPELTRTKGSCLQKLVTWLELKKLNLNLINSRIVSMDNQLKLQKPIIPIFSWLE